ncbi:MAG: EamA family transporter [Flavisolibacter sp.]|nr:EamA family transporter [Flavisolibacter sp.]
MASENKALVILAFAAIYFVWGSTYVVVLFALKEFPPFLLGFLRYIIAGSILLIWTILQGEKDFEWQTVTKNALVGILILIGGSFAVTWTQQYLPSSLAAIVISSEPFWFVILDKKQWRNYFSNPFIISGVLTGFTGILFLFGFNQEWQDSHLNKIQLLSGLILILGSVSWVSGSLYAKYNPSKGSNKMKVCIQLLVSALILLVTSFSLGEPGQFSFATVSPKGWLSLFFLAVMGSVITYNAYIWLLSKKPAVIVGTFAYVNPIVAVLLGMGLANETLALNH